MLLRIVHSQCSARMCWFCLTEPDMVGICLWGGGGGGGGGLYPCPLNAVNHPSQETVRPKKKCDIPESLPQISISIIKKRVTAK